MRSSALQMLVVHHGSNISTCSRRISFTRLIIIPLVPGEKVSAVMYSKQFLAYAVHIDWCYHSIHKHSSRSQHAPLTSGMHRRLIFNFLIFQVTEKINAPLDLLGLFTSINIYTYKQCMLKKWHVFSRNN